MNITRDEAEKSTIKEIGRLLTHLGAKTITPMVIAKTITGDLE